MKCQTCFLLQDPLHRRSPQIFLSVVALMADTVGHVAEPMDTVSTSRYHLVKKIGQGSFGKVYLATDRSSGATVAIKLSVDDGHESQQPELLAHESLRKRFFF